MSLIDEEPFRQVLIDYQKGASTSSIREIIQKNIKGEKSGYNIYSKKLFGHEGSKSAVNAHKLTKEFLELLNIDETSDEYGLLISMDLYHLLTRLKGRHRHLEKLVEIIQEAEEPKSWTWSILLSILGSAGVGLFFYFYPHFFWIFIDWFTKFFPALVRWLCFMFTQIRTVAIIGMAWQSAVLVYNWYDTFKYGPNPSPDRLRNLIFKTLGIAMNISGNVLMYLAHGSLGPVAAILFIACSFMDVLDTIHLLCIKYENSPFKLPILKGTRFFNKSMNDPKDFARTAPISINEKAHRIRLDKLQERDLNILWIKLAATALISISIILWCTMPSSVVLSLSFLIFGLLVNKAKDFLIKRIENQYAEESQNAMRIVYKDDPAIIARAQADFNFFAISMIDKITDEKNPSFNEDTEKALGDALHEKRKELSNAENFSLARAKEEFNNTAHLLTKFAGHLTKTSSSSNQSPVAPLSRRDALSTIVV